MMTRRRVVEEARGDAEIDDDGLVEDSGYADGMREGEVAYLNRAGGEGGDVTEGTRGSSYASEAREMITEDAARPRVCVKLRTQSKMERAEHEATHLPFRSWFPSRCVRCWG